MELEQRYAIKFFADEGMQGVQILSRLRDHYGAQALSRTKVYDWINEVKRGRTDLNTGAAPEGSLMKVFPLSLLESSMPIHTSPRDSSPVPEALRHQQSAAIQPKSWG
jgi:hypothetical protein